MYANTTLGKTSLSKARLDALAADTTLYTAHPDPLWIARRYRHDPKAILVCALFAYGRATQVVSFLERLPFPLLASSQPPDPATLPAYRFQKREDVAQLFATLQRAGDLEAVFMEGYSKRQSSIEGIFALIDYLSSLNPYRSRGYTFLLGRSWGDSAYKRWNLFLRWMVRREWPDLGLWKGVDPAHLIIPLDTHLCRIARQWGLLKGRRCNLEAAIELTRKLRSFDPADPTRYDFALYRLGQLDLV
ncbi:MAG: TIGR02757 family protein [Nitratiruptor sp.]|nr:TIGR02757 family protein [Nitratiruptor sp.]NPA84070.1 TIGR02757 family protein [Campylobacterota bacterium]